MESFEQKPIFNIEESLGKIEGVSDVKKIELDKDYFDSMSNKIDPEVLENIKDNYSKLEAYNFKYSSDGLLISGFIWSPKNIKEKLSVVIWNRGGTGEFSGIGKNRGSIFTTFPCELAKNNAIVMASEYRGGIGSEGKDTWGGDDINDVVKIKEIASKLPMCKPGKSIVAGYSRGGMMSYLLAKKEPWVKAVISLAGTTDLIDSAKERPEMYEVFEEAFGGAREEMEKRSATSFYNEIPKDLPILMLHGTNDERVSIDQARKLYELLNESGHNVEYKEFENADHYFYALKSPQYKETIGIVKDFLNKNL